MKTDFFKDAYDFELTLREKLVAMLATPLTVMTLLSGVFVFLVQRFKPSAEKFELLFAAALSGFALSLVVAVYHIFRGTVGYRYKCVAAGDDLKNWYDSLLRHYAGNQALADAAFDAGIVSRYIEATRANAKNNQSKIAHVAIANRAIACALAFAVFSGIPYFISSYSKPEKPIRVEIVK